MGSHVARHLLEAGHEVVVVDDLSGGFKENVPRGALFTEVDITDAGLVAQLFDDGNFNYVFHLAAYAAEGLSHYIRTYNYINNLLGSMNLINQSVNHDVERFVFTSSMAVYGTNQLPFSEDMVPYPEDPYGTAKLAVEHDLACAAETFDLHYTIFRPHNVYGPGQNIGDRYRNVIGIFMNQLMQDKPLTIFGDGLQTRAFSYIDDVAPIIVKSVNIPETNEQVYNIGADTPYPILHLAHVVALAMGVEEFDIEHMPERYEVRHAFTSHDKMREMFGDYTPVDLIDGVTKMAEWALERGPQTATQVQWDLDITRNFPAGWADYVSASWGKSAPNGSP